MYLLISWLLILVNNKPSWYRKPLLLCIAEVQEIIIMVHWKTKVITILSHGRAVKMRATSIVILLTVCYLFFWQLAGVMLGALIVTVYPTTCFPTLMHSRCPCCPAMSPIAHSPVTSGCNPLSWSFPDVSVL